MHPISSTPFSPIQKAKLPKDIDLDSLQLIDLNPFELAKQITIRDHSICNSIDILEFQDMNWIKQKHLSPNIIRLIDRYFYLFFLILPFLHQNNSFRKTTSWICTTIVREENLSKRIKLLSFMIDVCKVKYIFK